MSLALLKSDVSQSDVEVAWATYHALVIAEIHDRGLRSNQAHGLARTAAQTRFQRLFNAWIG